MFLALDALAPLPDGDIAQRPVVHVEAAAEINFFGVNVQLVAAEDMVIEHGAEQVVRRRDGVQIARKVQVDLLHGHHLCVAAARGAPFYAEHGAERRLAEGQTDLFALPRHAVGKADGNGRLALARRGGIDRRYEDEFALLFGMFGADFGFIFAVTLDIFLRKSELGGDLADILHFAVFCDFDVRQHTDLSDMYLIYSH